MKLKQKLLVVIVILLVVLSGCNNLPTVETVSTQGVSEGVSTPITPTVPVVIEPSKTMSGEKEKEEEPVEVVETKPAPSSLPENVIAEAQSADGSWLRLLGNLTRPSDTVVLEWFFAGEGETITIERKGKKDNLADLILEKLPREGVMEQTFPKEAGGQLISYQMSANDLFLHIAIPCEYEWLLASPIKACPDQGVQSKAIFQSFEQGFLLFFQERNTLYYSDWTGKTHGNVLSNFDPDADLVVDESLPVPAGLQQPRNALGKLWREEKKVRDLLGWAIEDEIAYDATWQSAMKKPSTTWVTLPGEGKFIAFDSADSTAQWEISYPAPLYQCSSDWFFNPTPLALGCAGEKGETNAAVQKFEGGGMVWIDALDVILVYSADNTRVWIIPDSFEHGVDPIDDANIVPPNPQLAQPQYGFGKVWRENVELNELLGWATSPDFGYVAQWQNASLTDKTILLMELPDKTILQLQTEPTVELLWQTEWKVK